jgi:tRNA (adenine57-N1/adenine58-N1)-methyltransferase
MGDLLATRVVVTDLARFRKVIDLSDSKLVGLPSGHIHSDELRKIPPGGSFEVRDKRYYILSCDMHDFILDGLKRNTQIVYPKDAGYILMKMDIAPGKRIGEAGTGSGALTAVFSRAIGDEGRLYTYEHDIGLVNHAISTLGLGDGDTNIVIHHRALEEGIDEQDLDAFFLDVREPWKVLKTVYDALKPSGHLGVLVPTTNQVSRMLQGLNLYDIPEELQARARKAPTARPDGRPHRISHLRSEASTGVLQTLSEGCSGLRRRRRARCRMTVP